MSKSELAKAKAKIERLKVELREAKARNTEIIHANVASSDQRENEIQKETDPSPPTVETK